ncbi:MAG: carbohydrate ABC transporter permease [Acetobacteraceae bacterium]
MSGGVGASGLAVREATPKGRAPLAAWSEQHIKWLLVAPAILLILAITVYPLGYSVWVSFVNFDFLIPGHAFVGLRNFALVLGDPIALHSVLVTAVFTVADVGIELVLGLALALALEKTFRGRGVLMAIFVLPLFVAPVIVGQFWSLLLQRPFGPVDYILSVVLRHPVTISWLTRFPWDFISIILADVWQWTSFILVILLAGLTAIPPELHEAAALDGARSWQGLRFVTLPQLVPMILLAVTFRLLSAVNLFDTIFMMTGGGPGTSTYTAAYYLYQTGFQQFHLSEATAGSWLFLILISVAIFLLVRRLLKVEEA